MKGAFIRTSAALLLFFAGVSASAQNDGYDVFVPIAKYMRIGDVEKLSAWFADNLDITVISTSNNSSRNQAKQILKCFFASHTPRAFYIEHKAGRANMKYALGSLNAGGETFIVTIHVCYKDSSYKIRQLKIERME